MMKNFLRDFQFGLRMLWKKPGFTLVALLALVLGIGANTAIYSIFYATLIADFAGAVSVGRAMRGMWYQVGTVDPSAISIVEILLMASALLACYLPARRAMQVDPMQALRDE
jgi:ABC-type lipoprotein release transport system permease subunit